MFTLEDMRRFLLPLKNKIYGVVGHATLTGVNNAPKTQMVQVQMFGYEVFELERIQEYGFENYPDPTDENNGAVLLAVGGNRGLASVIRVHNRELRPKTLVAGEVMLYSKFGQKIYLKADGSVLVAPAAGQFVNVGDEGGNAVALDTIMDKFNSHTHATAGTGPPSVPSTSFVAADFTVKVKAK